MKLEDFGAKLFNSKLKVLAGTFPQGEFLNGGVVGGAIRPMSPHDALSNGNEDVPGHGASRGMRLCVGFSA